MASPTAVPERLHVAGRWLFAAVIPASALAVGSLTSLALVVVALTASLATTLLWAVPISRISRSTRWTLIAAAVLIGATALQCLPLPAAFVRAVSPTTADVWARALLPFHEEAPAWHSISVDSSTRVELLRGLFYLSIFLSGVRVTSDRDGARFLERLVIISAVVMSFSALAHPALGAEKVFGVYRPRELYAYQTGYYAPLLNTNHLAAYLNIGVCVALDVAIRDRREKIGSLLIAAVLLLAGTSVWASSRGGMGSLAVGIALTLWLRRKSAEKGMLILGVLIALGGAVLIALGLSDAARDEIGNTDLSKLEVAREAFRLVPRAPIWGYGRGGFEGVFPLVKTSAFYETSTHPENIVAQWLTEWGIPVSLLGAGFLSWALRPSVVRARVRPPAGAWAAIVGCVLHDMVDYHLEVPGVVALLIPCVVLVVGARPSGGDTRAFEHLRGLVWGVAGAVVLSCLIVIPLEGNSLAEDRIQLSRLSIDSNISSAVFRSRLREAVLRHPAEAFLPLMGAVRAQVFGEDRVIPWIGSALERNPQFGRAHLVLARTLASRNPSQARLEYRLASSEDRTLRLTAITEASRLVRSLDDALELVPDNAEGVNVLDQLARLLGERLPSTAVVLDRSLLKRMPTAQGPLLREAAAAHSDVSNGEPWCVGSECSREALLTAERAAKAMPNVCQPHVLLAQAHAGEGERERAAALDALIAASTTVEDGLDCRKWTINVATQLGQEDRVDSMVDDLSRYVCETPDACVELFRWLGEFEEGRHHDVRALSFYKTAAKTDPNRDDLQRRILSVATRTDQIADALEANDVLLRSHPNDPGLLAGRQRLKERAFDRRLAPPMGQ